MASSNELCTSLVIKMKTSKAFLNFVNSIRIIERVHGDVNTLNPPRLVPESHLDATRILPIRELMILCNPEDLSRTLMP